MSHGIHAEALQALEVDFLDVGRRGLQDYLVLIVVLKPVGVLAVAAVGGAAGGLHIGDVPGLRSQHPQKSRRVHRPGAELDIIRLQDGTAIFRPVAFQGENQLLKGHQQPPNLP